MIGSSGCRRHEGALAALAGHSEFSELTSAGRAALEHVDRCPACATTLGELMLTAMALRRMQARRANPSVSSICCVSARC